MSTSLLIGAVVVATLACPAMMWWRSRRGTSCCGARVAEPPPSEGLEKRLGR
jgi:hypothetical protein